MAAARTVATGLWPVRHGAQRRGYKEEPDSNP